MQREELSGSRNRQAAETKGAQNEGQIWQRHPFSRPDAPDEPHIRIRAVLYLCHCFVILSYERIHLQCSRFHRFIHGHAAHLPQGEHNCSSVAPWSASFGAPLAPRLSDSRGSAPCAFPALSPTRFGLLVVAKPHVSGDRVLGPCAASPWGGGGDTRTNQLGTPLPTEVPTSCVQVPFQC
jgi:hypothetical protein